MKQTTLTREAIYKLVWSKTITELSKEYRISSSDLRKLCKHYIIPIPPSGYWQKIKHSKPTTVITLPDRAKEEKIELVSRENGDGDIPFLTSPFNKRVYELQNHESLNLSVSLQMKKPHSLVAKTKKKLEELDKMAESNYEIRRKLFKDILPIHTDIKLRNRALKIMNILVTFIYKNNHSIVFEYDRCHVEMFGQRTEINLRQKINRVRAKDGNGWGGEKWVKSNKLEFQAGPSYSHKCWIDKDNKQLETYIPHIIAWIEQECKYWHDLRKRQAEQESINAMKKAEEVEKQRVLKLEKEKYDQLINDSNRWHQAAVLRGYIEAAKISYKSISAYDENKTEWFNWASKIANSIDPLVKNKVDQGDFDILSVLEV